MPNSPLSDIAHRRRGGGEEEGALRAELHQAADRGGLEAVLHRDVRPAHGVIRVRAAKVFERGESEDTRAASEGRRGAAEEAPKCGEL